MMLSHWVLAGLIGLAAADSSASVVIPSSTVAPTVSAPTFIIQSSLILPSAAATLASSVTGSRKAATTVTGLPKPDEGSGPCAIVHQMTATQKVDQDSHPTVPAKVAYDCMKSVPFNSDAAVQLLDGLLPYLEWQSNLDWTAKPPAEYAEKVQPGYDFRAVLAQMRDNATKNAFESEYDFEFGLYKAVQQVHDGHFVYIPTMLRMFLFGRNIPLASVSKDGTSLPEVFVMSDILNVELQGGKFDPSPVSKVNGRDVNEFLDELADLGSPQDKDAQWNGLFWNNAQISLQGGGTGLGLFPGGARGVVLYPEAWTNFTFANGSTLESENYAQVIAQVANVTSGPEFYAKNIEPYWYGAPPPYKRPSSSGTDNPFFKTVPTAAPATTGDATDGDDASSTVASVAASTDVDQPSITPGIDSDSDTSLVMSSPASTHTSSTKSRASLSAAFSPPPTSVSIRPAAQSAGPKDGSKHKGGQEEPLEMEPKPKANSASRVASPPPSSTQSSGTVWWTPAVSTHSTSTHTLPSITFENWSAPRIPSFMKTLIPQQWTPTANSWWTPSPSASVPGAIAASGVVTPSIVASVPTSSPLVGNSQWSPPSASFSTVNNGQWAPSSAAVPTVPTVPVVPTVLGVPSVNNGQWSASSPVLSVSSAQWAPSPVSQWTPSSVASVANGQWSPSPVSQWTPSSVVAAANGQWSPSSAAPAVNNGLWTPSPVAKVRRGNSNSTDSDDVTQKMGYPKAIIDNPDNVGHSGYFVDGTGYDDTAVLVLADFAGGDDSDSFQDTNKKFLDRAVKAGKKKLIIDLSANGGGSILLAYDLFKQLFPSYHPDALTRWRAHFALNLLGQQTSNMYYQDPKAWQRLSSDNSSIKQDEEAVWDFKKGLDQNDQPFTSWDQKYGMWNSGPGQDHYTSPIKFNLSDPIDLEATGNITITGFDRAGSNASSLALTQPFLPENIVLLYDGFCASTCTIFSEMMRQQGKVRNVAMGGRPTRDIIQAVGGTRGAQVENLNDLYSSITNMQGIVRTSLVDIWSDTILGNYSDLPLLQGSAAASLNVADQIRKGDKDQVPLQFQYEPADCRIYYTSKMIIDQSVVWKTVADTAWGGRQNCVAGSLAGGAGAAAGNGTAASNKKVSAGKGTLRARSMPLKHLVSRDISDSAFEANMKLVTGVITPRGAGYTIP